MSREAEFVACPTCKQYSHSIGEDRLAAAFNHFQMMLSHRVDGIPTQHCFDEATRDAAQVLMAAARHTPPVSEVTEEMVKAAYYEGYGDGRSEDYEVDWWWEHSETRAALSPEQQG